MKTSAIVCTTLAAVMGLGTGTALAAPGDRAERLQNQRERLQDQRQRLQDQRQRLAQQREHLNDRRHRLDHRAERLQHQQRQQAQRRWVAPSHAVPAPRYYHSQPQYVYSQPRYVYTQPRYVVSRPAAPRYYRGGYLPHQYRQPTYYVNHWQGVHGLYAPPYGHQWVQVGNDYLLIALASGLIANLLTM